MLLQEWWLKQTLLQVIKNNIDKKNNKIIRKKIQKHERQDSIKSYWPWNTEDFFKLIEIGIIPDDIVNNYSKINFRKSKENMKYIKFIKKIKVSIIIIKKRRFNIK